MLFLPDRLILDTLQDPAQTSEFKTFVSCSDATIQPSEDTFRKIFTSVLDYIHDTSTKTRNTFIYNYPSLPHTPPMMQIDKINTHTPGRTHILDRNHHIPPRDITTHIIPEHDKRNISSLQDTSDTHTENTTLDHDRPLS